MIENSAKKLSLTVGSNLLWLFLISLLFMIGHLILLLLTTTVEIATLIRFPVAITIVILLWNTAAQHEGRSKKGWRLVALAVFTWFMADVLYGWTEIIARIPPEQAPWLSILYFLSTFIQMLSVTYLGYETKDSQERTAWLLETAIIVIGFGILIWILFLGQAVATKPVEAVIIDVISPVVGLSLLGFMFSFLLSKRQGIQTSLLLTLGTLCIAILIEGADVVRAYGTYQTGHVIDVFASIAYVLFGAAGIASLIPESRITIERNWVRLVSILPYAVFAIAFCSFLAFFLTDGHENTPKIVEFGVIIGIGILAFLTGWRTMLANQVNVNLTNELLESDERLQLALQGSNDGIWDWKLSDGTIRQSPRLRALLGYPEEEVIRSLQDWQSMTHPEDLERVQEETWKHVKGETDLFSLETRYQCANGDYRWFLLRGIAVRHNNKTVRMAGSLTDITGRSGVYDPLTGLANRVLFREYLERAMKRFTRYGDAFTVMFLDLNDFKIVNDTLGHLIGDQLLVQAAQRLEQALRQGDTLARLGGDEFAVLAERRNLPDKTTFESLSTATLAERLIRRIEMPFEIGDRTINVSVSIGIVDSNSGFTRVDEFLSAADTAMYHAKATQQRIAFFDQAMSIRLNNRLELVNALRHAISNNQLMVYYQAILETNHAKVIGFEALLRWKRSSGELTAPDVFIPIAEQSGFIYEIGAWVLTKACETATKWNSELSVSVNVSSRQFDNDNFVGLVHQVLQQTKLAPNRLILEITENALLESAEVNLIALRALGVRVQIDDFGTGYSSLSYLHRFPVSALKVDKSFVRDIDKNETRAIAKAIILLAQNLNLKVIAEGVETQAQWAVLKELQCDAVQGYLFAQPLPEEQLTNVQ